MYSHHMHPTHLQYQGMAIGDGPGENVQKAAWAAFVTGCLLVGTCAGYMVAFYNGAHPISEEAGFYSLINMGTNYVTTLFAHI